jgi:hypothetical protein
VVAVVEVSAVAETEVLVVDLVAVRAPDCIPHDAKTVIKIANRKNFMGGLSM